MTDFQISLAIIGFLIVMGVVAFNRWQEHQHRQRLERDTGPTFGSHVPPPVAPSELRQEPTITKPAEIAPTSPIPVLTLTGIDAKLNYVVNMDASDAVPTDHIKSAFTERVFNRRILWQGYNENTHQWDAINMPGRYQRISFAVPLVDRLGAINEHELDEFYSVVKTCADKWMGVIDLPSKQDALHRAKELDEFCMLADVSVGINIIPAEKNDFSVAKISQVARSFEMQQVNDREFCRLDERGNETYKLSISGAPEEPELDATAHGLTFIFDVPLVASGLDAFDEMLAYARVMASTLSGSLVDDNRHVLTDAGIEKIRQQLSEIYSVMNKEDIPPGSERAISLFS